MFAVAFLVVATIAGVSGVISAKIDVNAAVGQLLQSTAYQAFQWASVTFLLGMLTLIVSLGLSGWVRSRRLGIISISIASTTLLTLGYFLLGVMQSF